MKTLFLIAVVAFGLNAQAQVLLDGGSSGVGPSGPDAQALKYFESNEEVLSAIQNLNAQGFDQADDAASINNFVGYQKCGKPSVDATWIACERLYVFSRSFRNISKPDEVRVVSAVVKTGIGTLQIQIIP